MFTMSRAYEGSSKINTDDFLTAVKHTSNYEGDLYYQGRLAMSCLGFSMEENIEILNKYGITAEVIKGQYKFKYIDPAKNTGKLFVDFGTYYWEGVLKLQVTIHDYSINPNSQIFDNTISVIEAVRDNWIKTNKVDIDNIHITSYLNRCETLTDLLFESCEKCTFTECRCKGCKSNKKTSKGCQCQAVHGCYKKDGE